MKNKRSWILFAAVAVLLGWTVRTILREQTPGQLWRALISADLRFLLAGLALMAAFIGCEALSTHQILRALGAGQSYRRCYFYSCSGFFFSNITPSATGGQPAQVFYMNRDGVPPAYGTIDMLLVTIGYHTAMVIYGILALIFCPHLPEQMGGGVGLLLGLGFSVFFFLNAAMILFLFRPGPARRLGSWCVGAACRFRRSLDREALMEKLDVQLREYGEGAMLIRARPTLLPRVLLLSCAQLGCSYFVTYMVYRAFHLSGAGFCEVFFLQVLCAIAVGYLPLPGAAGAAENVFLRSFTVIFGAVLGPAMILTRLVSCYVPLVATGISVLAVQLRLRRQKWTAPAAKGRESTSPEQPQ